MAVAIITCPHCGKEIVVQVATIKDADKFNVVVDKEKSRERKKLPIVKGFREFPVAD